MPGFEGEEHVEGGGGGGLVVEMGGGDAALLPEGDVGGVGEWAAVVGGIEGGPGDVEVELDERLLAGGDLGGCVAARGARGAVPVVRLGAGGAQACQGFSARLAVASAQSRRCSRQDYPSPHRTTGYHDR